MGSLAGHEQHRRYRERGFFRDDYCVDVETRPDRAGTMAMQGQSPHSKMTGPVVLESAIPARLTGRHAGQLLTPKTRKRLRYDKGAYTPSISAPELRPGRALPRIPDRNAKSADTCGCLQRAGGRHQDDHLPVTPRRTLAMSDPQNNLGCCWAASASAVGACAAPCSRRCRPLVDAAGRA